MGFTFCISNNNNKDINNNETPDKNIQYIKTTGKCTVGHCNIYCI